MVLLSDKLKLDRVTGVEKGRSHKPLDRRAL